MNDALPPTTGPPLYPPTVHGPKTALPLWRFLPTFIRNPLKAIPEPVYHEPIYLPSTMRGRMAWVTDPELVEQILLDDHEDFPKTLIEKRVFERIIGDGILTSEGMTWRWQRHAVAPLFRHGEILASVPAMADAAGLVRRIRLSAGMPNFSCSCQIMASVKGRLRARIS